MNKSFTLFALIAINFQLMSMEPVAQMQTQAQAKNEQESAAKLETYRASIKVLEHTQFFEDHSDVSPLQTIVAMDGEGFGPLFFFKAPKAQEDALKKDQRVRSLESIEQGETFSAFVNRMIEKRYPRDQKKTTQK